MSACGLSDPRGILNPGGGGHRVAPGGRNRWLRSRRFRRLPTCRHPYFLESGGNMQQPTEPGSGL